MRHGRSRLLPTLLILAWLPWTGCAPPAIDGGFDSGNPSANIYAMVDAANRGDTDAIPHIIEYLDSPDPAVRFIAILSLRDLTGTDLGYRYHDKRRDRRQAILRWIDWYETTYGATGAIDLEDLGDEDRLESEPQP